MKISMPANTDCRFSGSEQTIQRKGAVPQVFPVFRRSAKLKGDIAEHEPEQHEH
jgi:hypothetical protein